HQELVTDMVELHEHLGARPAIWVGHDLGSPVAAALAAHHRDQTAELVLISVPYLPNSFALPNLLPLINRQIYPESRYPDGQWDYYRFYLTRFDQSVDDFEADIPSTLAAIYQPGHANTVDAPSPSASVAAHDGWFGPAHRAPRTEPDPALWPRADFNALTQAFQRNGFRPANAWYLNDDANIAYAKNAPSKGQLETPALFVNGERDPICDINRSQLAQPMKHSCRYLTIVNLLAGHWVPLERKVEVNNAIRAWLADDATNPPKSS
ncbi:MAG: alpha/beta hydrolase, partial [Mycobacterium sp.]